jgi:hypothetical protein
MHRKFLYFLSSFSDIFKRNNMMKDEYILEMWISLQNLGKCGKACIQQFSDNKGAANIFIRKMKK